jgi:ParB/RepB/Spo0J family partition protein
VESQTAEPEGNHANDPVELLNIRVDDIEFGTRARKNYKDLAMLADDFRKRGIIQPLAVKRQPADAAKPFFLLAGGRRFSAAAFAQLQFVPCRVYQDNLSPLDIREIELMENVQRSDLTWPEEVWLTEEIHRLQVEKFGAAVGPSEGHSASDTAKILQVSPMSVSRDRALAAGLEKYGDKLKTQAKTKSEALRTLKRLDRQDADKKITKKFEEKVALEGDDVWKRKLINGYTVGDFFEGVSFVPEKSVYLVEIDPPYGIDLLDIKRGAERMEDKYEEVEESDYSDFLTRVFSECHRVMLPSSWILTWCGWQWYPTVVSLLEKQGFNVRKSPAIWYKTKFAGQTHQPELNLASGYELLVYASKGNAIIARPGHLNVYPYPTVYTEDKAHGTERPVELMTDIIKTFSGGNQTIMSPFLGSGNTLLAVSNCSCSGFGWDLHGAEYRPTFVRRVTEGKLREYKSYRKDAL